MSVQEKSISLPTTGFVRLNALLRVIPVSASTIWRKVKEGEFPPPVKLSERITAWRVEDVRTWLQSKGVVA